jgi:hypothetical protein
MEELLCYNQVNAMARGGPAVLPDLVILQEQTAEY